MLKAGVIIYLHNTISTYFLPDTYFLLPVKTNKNHKHVIKDSIDH